MASQSAITGLQDLARQADRLRTSIGKQTTRQLNSVSIKTEVKDFVQAYFRVVRPHILRLGVDVGAIDGSMQHFLELANRRGAVSQYKKSVSEIREMIQTLEIVTERHLSDQAGEVSAIANPIEAQILATLQQLLPNTANSYEQIVDDLSRTRLSYRGTATELREVLRETLDKLAPNEDVEKSPGFQLEKGRERPTMAQKARFILRQRGGATNAIDAPKRAIEIVEQTVSSFVRSTYDRGSIDTHTATGISKAQVVQLKMYVDTVLCELLEIHHKS